MYNHFNLWVNENFTLLDYFGVYSLGKIEIGVNRNVNFIN